MIFSTHIAYLPARGIFCLNFSTDIPYQSVGGHGLSHGKRSVGLRKMKLSDFILCVSGNRPVFGLARNRFNNSFDLIQYLNFLSPVGT